MHKYSKYLLVLLSLIVILGACQVDTNVRIIKLGHALPTSHPVHEAMVFMAKRVEEKSKGELIVKIYPNQQLGTERELVELLQIGSLGMTKVASAIMESFAPQLQVFSQPYLFRNDAHRNAVLQGEIGKELLLAGEDFWLRGLCYYDAGKRSFYTTKKSIEKPEDLIGFKIRVMESNTAINTVKSFGGSPTPVSYGELYSALQQGVVDGAENNPPSFLTSRHYEVSKYYSINEHTAIPDMLIISTKVWEKLSDQERQWVQEAADESAVFQYELWAKSVEESLATLKEAGVEITYPDQEPFRKAVEPIYEQMKLNNPEMYSIIENIRNYE
ncbi:TRAP transporter substrate-binding protein [Fulvivirgaceae bacterium LMO-SS25]